MVGVGELKELNGCAVFDDERDAHAVGWAVRRNQNFPAYQLGTGSSSKTCEIINAMTSPNQWTKFPSDFSPGEFLASISDLLKARDARGESCELPSAGCLSRLSSNRSRLLVPVLELSRTCVPRTNIALLFLPLTTLVYAWMANTGQPIADINLLILLVTIVIDLGGLGGGEYHRRRRWTD